jgi:hypothetical protein
MLKKLGNSVKSYSILPADAHDETCQHSTTDEQPTTVEIWLRKDDDENINVIAVNPDESTEWLTGFTDDGTVAYEKKQITGLLIQFGYKPSGDWQITDQFGDECTRTFKLVDSIESDTP